MKNTEDFSAESLAIAGGYDPASSQNSIKPPIYQTSSFKFNTAAEGKAFFEKAKGDAPLEERNASLIYSRLNHPNVVNAEFKLAQLDGAGDAAFFESGMAAISTTLLAFAKAGDLILSSSPLYGGTDTFIKKHLIDLDIQHLEFAPGATAEEIRSLVEAHPRAEKIACIYLESPANPTLSLTDFEMIKTLRDELAPNAVIIADNTYMGPIFQKPLSFGVDINVYSATKYIGGHSDIIAGAASGSEAHMKAVKKKRAILGNTASAFTSWLLSRSIETIALRMEKQADNAMKIAEALKDHPKIERFHYLGLLDESDPLYTLHHKQCSSPGAMMAFEVKGGETEAFRFLDSLKLAHLAISLGSNETLVSHPFTMSSSNMDEADRLKNGITPALIRVSVGIENTDDLIKDFQQALAQI
jgi:methionine-gamma-lyase